jgi:hypothetical protein
MHPRNSRVPREVSGLAALRAALAGRVAAPLRLVALEEPAAETGAATLAAVLGGEPPRLLGHAIGLGADALALVDLWEPGPRLLRVARDRYVDVAALLAALPPPPRAPAREFAPSDGRPGWIDHVARFVPAPAASPEERPLLRLLVAIESGLAQRLRVAAARALGVAHSDLAPIDDAQVARLVFATVRLPLANSRVACDLRYAGHATIAAATLLDDGRPPATRQLLALAARLLAPAQPLLAAARAAHANALLIVGDMGVRPLDARLPEHADSSGICAAHAIGLTPLVAHRRRALEAAPPRAGADDLLLQPVAFVDFAGALLAYAAAHEFGHFLGAGHDAETFDTGAPPLAPWARAAVIRGRGRCWQTVMGGVAVRGAGNPLARRIPYFSTARDVGLGVVPGHEAADNARIIGAVAPALAQFRF